MIKVGDRIDNRYRITGRIGSGGMAEVYEATDFINKMVVAVKIIKEELLSNPENVKRFEYEAATCAQMNHPNIIRVYNQGYYENRPYMVYEYIKGQTLFEKLEFLTQLSVLESCEIMVQLLDTVFYIHNHGIIHRDIKPQNIFYLSNGTIKLSDFGIAVNTDIKENNNGGIIGSVLYLAPEICEGMQPTIQSDIYALGVTFFELLTGRLPFEDGHAVDIAIAQIKKPFPSVCDFAPNVPKQIDNIIRKACEKDLNRRYKTAKEMLIDIQNAMANKDNFKEKYGFLKKLFGFK